LPKLPVVTGAEVIKALKRAGLTVRRQRGSHVIMQDRQSHVSVSVPVHGGEDMPSGTLRGILHKLDLSIEEFRRLLK